MDDFDRFDLELFGIWTDSRAYGDGVSGIAEAATPVAGELSGELADGALVEAVRSVLLETKSAEGALDATEELRRLLNEMTVEMGDQFATFRRLRAAAEQALQDGDEAAQKLARADVKAATDAMSLIVRTLEKVDALQRQLARDRALDAERLADQGGYEEAKARFMQLIEDRAHERAKILFAEWQRAGPAEDRAGRAGAGSSQSAADPPGAGKASPEGTEAAEEA